MMRNCLMDLERKCKTYVVVRAVPFLKIFGTQLKDADDGKQSILIRSNQDERIRGICACFDLY